MVGVKHPAKGKPAIVREQEVAKLLLRGLSNREIASGLGITVRSVKKYMAILFRKYGVTDGNKRVRLVALIIEEIGHHSEDGEIQKS